MTRPLRQTLARTKAAFAIGFVTLCPALALAEKTLYRANDLSFDGKESLDAESKTEMVANPAYWEGAPKIDRIEFTAIADSEARKQAMLAGRLDVSSLTRDQEPLYTGNPKVTVQNVPSGSWFGIAFLTDKAPMDDPRVRKAVRIAVDRQAMMTLLAGAGAGVVTCDIPIGPDDPFHADLTGPQDIAATRQLLAEAGHPDGVDLDVHTADLEPGMVQCAEVFQQQAAPAGIRVKIVQDAADRTWNDVWMKQNADTSWGKRQADQILNEACRTGAGWNESHFANPAFDAELAAARRERDMAKAKAHCVKAQQILFDQGGTFIGYLENERRVMSAKVTGIPDKPEDCIRWNLVDLAPQSRGGPVIATIAERVVLALLTLGLIAVLVFAGLAMMPGDACTAHLGRGASETALAACRARMGMNDPALVRFGRWAWDGVHGDLGISAQRGKPITGIVGWRLRNTLILASVASAAGLPLTPTLRIGAQIDEALRRHTALDAQARAGRCLELLEKVRLPQPQTLLRRYPHELSGGQVQRVAIAMALAGGPDLLALDEPTTGLDVTTQAAILALLAGLQRQDGMAMICVSHDLGVLARLCGRLAVMYAGRLIEVGPTAALPARPAHPYAAALLASVPRLSQPALPEPIQGAPPTGAKRPAGCGFAPRCALTTARCGQERPPLAEIAPQRRAACFHALTAPHPPPPLCHPACARPPPPSQGLAQQVSHLSVSSARTTALDRLLGPALNLRQPVLTVRDVSFSLHGGEVLGLVGESGGGKSTLLRAVAGLWPPSAARPAAAYPAAACPAAACPVTVRLGLSAEIG